MGSNDARPGLAALGSYVPPGRLALSELRRLSPGGSGPAGCHSVSVPGADEDVVTMAVESCYAVTDLVGTDLKDIDALYLATCSSPLAEHSAASEVARGLGLAPTASVHDLGGSTLAGVQALLAARDAVASGRISAALVAVAERRRGEPGTPLEALGAGAAAALVVVGGAVEIGAVAAHRSGVPTRWRPDGASSLRVYEDPRYELNGQILPSVGAVTSALPVTNGFLAAGPLDPRSLSSVARTSGLASVGGSAVAEIGDIGAAAPLMALADALTSDSTYTTGVCLAVAPGSGALGFAVQVHAPLPVWRPRTSQVTVGYVEYLRRYGVLINPGAPEPIVSWPATPGAWRAAEDGGGLKGSRCRRCGSLAVPARQVCVDCGATDSVIDACTRRGRVVTFNVQHLVPVSPEPAPVAVGVVRLDGEESERGGKVSAMFTDSPLDELHVGRAVELVYRRVGAEGGLPKYGWKARLVGDQSAVHGTEGRDGSDLTKVGVSS